LAGRIAYKELSGFNAAEINTSQQGSADQLWLRGGFPNSFLAKSEDASMRWRLNFISTYLERDVPQFGLRIPAVTLRRLWTMLAHNQSAQLNIAQLGASLDVAAPTAKRYIELLEDLLLIRSVRPWFGNIGKRLVKAPKIYIRDSGLVHALLNLKAMDDLLGHPVAGASWEAYVVENLISCLPLGVTAWFYRTAAGAEIDLVIEPNDKKRYAIEIKRSLSPSVSKGFYHGCEDINAAYRYLVYPGTEKYPIGNNVMVMPLLEMMETLRVINP
jgi:predicted AAA+ superfamily ATPase